MQAAVLRGGVLVIEDRPDPTPGPGELVIENRRVGICGSDLAADRYAPDGTVLGHEFAGEVVAVGAGVAGWQLGQAASAMPLLSCGQCGPCLTGNPVRCRQSHAIGIETPGAFAEYVVVSAAQTFALPPSVGLEAGALVEPLAIGLHLVNVARVHMQERVVVLGAGPIGIAVVSWLRLMGVRSVVASDPMPFRRAWAQECGANATVDPRQEDVGVAHRRLTAARPDVVFDCAGGLVAESMRVVTRGGRVLVAGFHDGPQGVDVAVGMQKDLTVSFASWYLADEFRYTLECVEQGKLPVDKMVTDHISLADLPATFAALKQPNEQGKVQICFDRHPLSKRPTEDG
jgi:(R,R)-butanediol dehydrogenase/meso-butanediol dehydrogenase/diacetyl reductase